VSGSAARRVSLEPAFLLHHYPWRDSSRILEFFSRAHGRVSLFSRASRRGTSSVAGALQPFGETLVSWSGRGEAGQLTGAERVGTPAVLAGDRLMSGFYANELLLKLLPKHDPHPDLYDAYATLLRRLLDTAADPSLALRLFEKRLLDELGWGLQLENDAATGQPIDAACSYRYRLDLGPERIDGVAEGTLIFSGASLLALGREDLADRDSLADARRLLRAALEQCLDGRPLRTREVLLEMRAHGGKPDGG
jgi:DNA repair protein RecO (recombination protein O)